jgi:lipoprotein-anchoring transpeptidase ErfK/SrfK
MNPNFDRTHEIVGQAREALRRGDKGSARALGEQAALLAPGMEDAWLILTASDPNPEDALAYARKALEINPQSPRARKAVEWAAGRLKQANTGSERVEMSAKPAASRAGIPIVREPVKERPAVAPKRNSRVVLFAGTFGLLAACVVFVFAAWSAASSPAFASLLESAPAPTQENLWAQVEIAKPFVTPIGEGILAQPPAANTPVIVAPTETPLAASTPTELPASIPTDMSIPAATETPGVLAMNIVEDAPTSAYVPPTYAPPAAPAAPDGTQSGVRWIDVDLTNQMVYAYEGDTIVNSFVVSTGLPATPTVTGKFKVWVKVRIQDMSGPGYYLKDVPFVMYFFKDYGLHGTYWHNNFGTPMSRGCVNLKIPDAEWLYNWASVGTVVNVHY